MSYQSYVNFIVCKDRIFGAVEVCFHIANIVISPGAQVILAIEEKIKAI